MEQWAHQGQRYEVNSMYLLPDDAWAYELWPSAGPAGRLIVLIADATPDDGPFTPLSSAHALVTAEEVSLPWPVLRRFVHLVDTSGDIVPAEQDETVTGDLSLSSNAWRFASRSFEVNSFHLAEHDCWCYELYEPAPTITGNNYIDVRIPDLQPASGPFLPARADKVGFASHGSCTIPWPVFRHFVDAVETDGPITDVNPPEPL